MARLLQNGKNYKLLSFESEQEFEKAVIENSEFLFGPDSLYFDIKKKIGKGKESYFRGIPDGFLIDFFEPNSPHLYFVENELSSHDPYSHIGEQLQRFIGAINTNQPQILNILTDVIYSRDEDKKRIEEKIKNTSFRNIHELLIYIVNRNNIKTVVVIDEETPDLGIVLNSYRQTPDLAVLQRYASDDGSIVYFYEPMRDELETFLLKDNPNEATTKEGRDFDTIVCPAFEDGFQRAFVESDAWWAIRLSQEAREKLRYLAIYEKSPVAAVRYAAEIDRIEPYKDSNKFIVYLKNKFTVGPIELDKDIKGTAPQGSRYTTLDRLRSAKKLSELWGI